MRNLKELKELAIHAAKGTTPQPTAEFSFTKDDVQDALREELRELSADYNAYRRNKYDIFEIIQEAGDEIIPKKVLDRLGAFAEVRNFANGQKVQFKVKKGRNRAKKFVTKASLSGVYETFRLDTDTFTMETSAVGGGAYIDFERYLMGEEDINESMQVLLEGFEDYVYLEIQKALVAVFTNQSAPAANRDTSSNFVAADLAALIATVKTYGDGAVIFAAPEFVAAMGADVVTTAASNGASVADIESIHNTGFISMFRGTPIVQLPQSYTDETNTVKVIDPQYCFIFPTGGEKVVKVGFEGDMIVKDYENRDNSMEIQAYKKIGVAITTYHNWAIYQVTSVV